MSAIIPAGPQERFEAIFDPAIRSDPYPAFRAAAHAAPFALPEQNMVVFGSYADCDQILRHPDGAVDRRKSTVVRNAIAGGADPAGFDTHSFLILDPPDHTRLRKLAQKAFSPRRIRQLQPEITAIVDGLLDRVADSGDVVEDLAYPLPVIVICRLLGVPVEDEPRFGQASKLIAQGLDDFLPVVGDLDAGRQERLDAATWMYEYLRELIRERRTAPRDDLMSALVAAEEAGEQLTEDEIVATCELLFVAGHETTVNLIANAALAMLTHGGQWHAAAENPGRLPSVVEETLRWDPPVQLSDRIAERDMIIGDTVVPAGDSAVLLLGAAHRDPAEYVRPDEFDPDRAAFRHLAFGHGAHFCLGAPLARLEAVTALTALTARFPNAHLAGEPIYRPNVSLRGMSHLPVTFS
ncbi:cytochrome P450 [Mycolicibacterium iranicum]|uniref:Steroid C26-monooxygenase n=1 Tax=Mycolicibacterium iranicum TaxID=912594 RepID=A0A839Q5Q8_MYCIR|nr:cytochrome P450 [Mycolicibacterium iranicum]MBB2991400.1 cytochrome P450 [Mycolicibacterium iranicum]